MTVRFMCCFCAEEIASDDPDARQIALIKDPGEDTASEQFFFCHGRPCFEATLHPKVRDSLEMEY